MTARLKRVATIAGALGLMLVLSGCHYHHYRHHGFKGHGYGHGYGHHGHGHHGHHRKKRGYYRY